MGFSAIRFAMQSSLVSAFVVYEHQGGPTEWKVEPSPCLLLTSLVSLNIETSLPSVPGYLFLFVRMRAHARECVLSSALSRTLFNNSALLSL